MERTTIAVDLANTVFQVAVANEHGQIIDRKRLGRSPFRRFLTTRPPSRVVMEACAPPTIGGASPSNTGIR